MIGLNKNNITVIILLILLIGLISRLTYLFYEDSCFYIKKISTQELKEKISKYKNHNTSSAGESYGRYYHLIQNIGICKEKKHSIILIDLLNDKVTFDKKYNFKKIAIESFNLMYNKKYFYPQNEFELDINFTKLSEKDITILLAKKQNDIINEINFSYQKGNLD